MGNTLSPRDITKGRKVYCKACDLWDGCKTNRIKPLGPKKAEILIVGDVVSTEEDRRGQIMSGKAGIFLLGLLKKHGVLENYSVRCTKAVRCAGDKIGVRRAETCAKEHLYGEIEQVKPTLIIAVGATALAVLQEKNKRQSITAVAGTEVKSPYGRVYALLSPGMVFRRDGLRQQYEQDIARIPKVIKGSVKSWEPEWFVAKSTQDVKDFHKKLLADKLTIAFDYETGNPDLDIKECKNPFLDGNVIACASIGNRKRAMVLPFPDHPDCPKKLRKYRAKKVVGDRLDHYDAACKPDMTGPYKQFAKMLHDKKLKKVAQNLAFELIWSRVYGVRPTNIVADTMMKQIQYDPDAAEGTKGLDAMCRAHLPKIGAYWVDNWQDEDGHKTYNSCAVPGKRLFRYSAFDAVAEAAINGKLNKIMDKRYSYDWQATHKYIIEVVVPLLARLHYNGWPVNKARGKKIVKKLDKVLAKEMKLLHEHSEVQEVVKRLNKIAWKKEKKAIAQLKTEKGREARKAKWQPITQMNPNSPDDKRMLYYDVMGLPEEYYTDSEQLSTKKDHIELLFKGKDNYPSVVKHLMNWLEASKLQGTYARKCVYDLRSDRGFVHATYKNETGTGRLNSEEPNGQNFPERSKLAPLVRSMFVSRYRFTKYGGLLIGADYGQIEPRVLAAISGETSFIQAFRKNEDIYLKIAYSIFVKVGTSIATKKKAKRDLDKKGKDSIYRFMAKQLLLGIMYGKTEFGLAAELGMEVESAAELIDAFWEAHKRIAKWGEKQVKHARKYGHVNTFGPIRSRWLPDINSDVDYIVRRAERQAKNAPIQGSASDVTIIAAHHCNERFKELGWPVVQWNQVHDAAYFDSRGDHKKRAVKLIIDTMQNIATIDKRLDWLKGVPLPVDPHTGKSWGKL